MKFYQGNNTVTLLVISDTPDFLMYLPVKEIYQQISYQANTNINKIFKNGMDKINSEIDCVDIITSIRKLKLLAKVLLTETQQSLAEFASQSVLNSSRNILESNRLASEVKLRSKRLPKSKDSCQTLAYENSKLQKVRTKSKQEHRVHIDLLIDSLCENRLTSIDNKLIKLISSSPQKFGEATAPK